MINSSHLLNLFKVIILFCKSFVLYFVNECLCINTHLHLTVKPLNGLFRKQPEHWTTAYMCRCETFLIVCVFPPFTTPLEAKGITFHIGAY